MLALILIHRDYYPGVPLLPWLHSTECCEHFFGCARRIIKDFTFLDLIYMMPKLTLLIEQDLRSHGRSNTKASAHRSGYHHSWYDFDDTKYHVLAEFPSDETIKSSLLPYAYDEAERLLELLGIPMSEQQTNDPASTASTRFMDAASKFVENLRSDALDLDPDEDLEPGIIEDLEASLSIDDTSSPSGESPTATEDVEAILCDFDRELMDHRSETTLQNLGVAAVATAVHETHIMYISVLCRVHFVLLTLIYSSDDLPEISELNHEAWRSQIQDFLDRVEAEMKFREQQALVQQPGPIGQAALQDPKAPQPGTPVSPTLPRKRSPLRLVLGGSLNYPVLVKERREHETAEAQASLPWRYRATLTGHIQTIPPEPTPSTSTHPSSGSEALPTVETEKLHVKLVNEIVRVHSAYYEQSGKRAGTGLERRERWMGALTRDTDARFTEVLAVAQSELKGKRKAFAELVTSVFPFWDLAKAGVSLARPLRAGSGVLVVHQGKLWFGLGMFNFSYKNA